MLAPARREAGLRGQCGRKNGKSVSSVESLAHLHRGNGSCYSPTCT